MYEDVKLYLDSGDKIIFLDEIMFTSSTLPKNSFALKGKNISYNDFRSLLETTTALCAVSADEGIEALIISNFSIDTAKFLDFLELLY